ncbi:sulfatase domain-containing protein [Ditylenchus destructor]|nr:sulfatase domain-containing protein [Ditylenchus destructor]
MIKEQQYEKISPREIFVSEGCDDMARPVIQTCPTCAGSGIKQWQYHSNGSSSSSLSSLSLPSHPQRPSSAMRSTTRRLLCLSTCLSVALFLLGLYILMDKELYTTTTISSRITQQQADYYGHMNEGIRGGRTEDQLQLAEPQIIDRRNLLFPSESSIKNPEPWKCRLTDKNPWDRDVLPYLNPSDKGPLANCTSTFIEMTELSVPPDSQILSVRKEFLDNITSCQHRCLGVALGNHSPWLTFDRIARPACDAFEVQCSLKNTTEIYKNLYYQIYRPSNYKEIRRSKSNNLKYEEGAETNESQQQNSFLNKKKQKLAEFIKSKTKSQAGFGLHLLVLDSVSRSQFFRSMQKTEYLLREEFEAIPFEYLNKVGENSQPNGYAFLMGKQIKTIPPIYTNSLLIFWSFHTRLEQKHRKPANPAALYLGYNKKRCKEPHTHLLEYFRQFIELYSDVQKKFSMTWMTDLGHDSTNTLYHSDDQFYHLMRDLKPKLEDSFLFVMGDHGNRMDPLSGTNAGVKEDNNPALFVILPKKLRRNWRLRAVLEENSRQLVSHYDVYATMVAIAKSSHTWTESAWESNWPYPQMKDLPRMHGSSLLHQLKKPRSCPSLRIPFDYCQCEWNVLAVDSSESDLVQKLGEICVSNLNSQLAAWNLTDRCANLRLKDDFKIEIEELNEMPQRNDSLTDAPINSTDLIQPNQTSSIFRIIFQTLPGGGQFWAYVEANFEPVVHKDGIQQRVLKDARIVSDHIARMNPYASQTDCATDFPQVQPYCYCKDIDKH